MGDHRLGAGLIPKVPADALDVRLARHLHVPPSQSRGSFGGRNGPHSVRASRAAPRRSSHRLLRALRRDVDDQQPADGLARTACAARRSDGTAASAHQWAADGGEPCGPCELCDDRGPPLLQRVLEGHCLLSGDLVALQSLAAQRDRYDGTRGCVACSPHPSECPLGPCGLTPLSVEGFRSRSTLPPSRPLHTPTAAPLPLPPF